jgi:hypothetical protein
MADPKSAALPLGDAPVELQIKLRIANIMGKMLQHKCFLHFFHRSCFFRIFPVREVISDTRYTIIPIRFRLGVIITVRTKRRNLYRSIIKYCATGWDVIAADHATGDSDQTLQQSRPCPFSALNTSYSNATRLPSTGFISVVTRIFQHLKKISATFETIMCH